MYFISNFHLNEGTLIDFFQARLSNWIKSNEMLLTSFVVNFTAFYCR